MPSATDTLDPQLESDVSELEKELGDADKDLKDAKDALDSDEGDPSK